MAVILVVDDAPDTRLQLNSILGNLGHNLVFATDGEVGFTSFERFQPDLVITDLVMPNMHGVRLIEHLKAIYPESKIIAVSGKAPEQLDRAVKAGAVAALTKPLVQEELVAAVDEALSSADPWGRGT